MKTILILATTAALTSCAGLKVVSQYGTAETDAKGNLVITPISKPIIIPLDEK